MTTRKITQGQSDATEFKERGLEAAFWINMKVFTAKFGARFPYWHFDLNCGCGINEKIGCIGSPLAFLRAADSVGCSRYFAGFCDNEQSQIAALMAREEVRENDQCFMFHGDNAALVQSIPDLIGKVERPHHAMGMVLSDPNGWGTPILELKELSEKCPKIDFALHWNTRVRRMARGHKWEFIDIDEAIAMLNKKHWLIRDPRGPHQWTVLIGRNYRIPDYKSLGFFHLDSPKGEDIMRRCKARLQDKVSDPQGDLDL